jgi:hypothetical protein
VQNISASARSQSTASQNIARNMQVLREISAQSADSTSATSHAIAKLADLSASLRKSITGFRLPGGSGSDMSGRHKTLADPAATQSAKAPASPASPPGAPSASGAYPNPKVKVLGGS